MVSEKNTCNFLDVALLQFSASWENAGESLSGIDSVLERVFSDGLPLRPDLVVLPEFFAVGFSMNPAVAEPAESSFTLDWMKSVSARYGCALAGSVPVSENGVRYNRLFFVYPDGEEVAVLKYDKGHLFFGGEDTAYVSGTRREVFEYKGWKILPNICFDLRFPEWCRNFAEQPYDLYLNVANWPVARNAAAEILLKARAIENVCWSVFCNRTGNDALLEYSGNSAVIDYRGRSKGKCIDVSGTEVVYARLEKEPMMRFREGFPILDLINTGI